MAKFSYMNKDQYLSPKTEVLPLRMSYPILESSGGNGDDDNTGGTIPGMPWDD